jgi:hypothetical protein
MGFANCNASTVQIEARTLTAAALVLNLGNGPALPPVHRIGHQAPRPDRRLGPGTRAQRGYGAPPSPRGGQQGERRGTPRASGSRVSPKPTSQKARSKKALRRRRMAGFPHFGAQRTPSRRVLAAAASTVAASGGEDRSGTPWEMDGRFSLQCQIQRMSVPIGPYKQGHKTTTVRRKAPSPAPPPPLVLNL